MSEPELRSPLASEGQGDHKVSGHLLWDSVEVSQLASHQLVPYSQMSLSRAEGRRQLEAAPFSPAEPCQAAQTAADISFLQGLCWCRHLTPCSCLCKDFVFSSFQPSKPNHDFPGLSLAFLPRCFAFLQSYSLFQLLFHRLWAIQLEI